MRKWEDLDGISFFVIQQGYQAHNQYTLIYARFIYWVRPQTNDPIDETGTKKPNSAHLRRQTDLDKLHKTIRKTH